MSGCRLLLLSAVADRRVKGRLLLWLLRAVVVQAVMVAARGSARGRERDERRESPWRERSRGRESDPSEGETRE